jgi:hypothetical protein
MSQAKLNNPSQAAQDWANKLGAAQPAYEAGVNGVKVAPGQLAAASADRWANNTVAAKPRFAANSAAVSLSSWQQSAVSKGGPRLASGATSAQPKMEMVFAKLFPAINSVVQGLPPRGTIQQNIARSSQFALAMNAKKGTFKS